jgi:hypothetical protein
VWEALHMARTGHDLQPARLEQRFLAGLIDSGVAIGLLGGAAFSAVETWRPHALEWLRPLTRAVQRMLEWTSSPRGQHAHRALTLVWGVTMRNARSPGMRIARIRRVDARTGGRVTVRSALRGAAFQLAWSIGAKRVTQPRFDRMKAAAQESSDQLAEVRRSHPDDPQAEAAFYSSQRRAPMVGCCGTLLALFAIQGLPVAFTSRRQNLFEWVAGTMTVRD